MSNESATLELVETEFNFNIIVAGLMAVIESRHNPDTAVRQWGGAERFEPFYHEGKRIVVAHAREGSVTGLVIMVRHAAYDKESDQRTDEWFVPYSELKNVCMVLKAIKRR